MKLILSALVLLAATSSCVETVAVRQSIPPLPTVLVSTPRAAWRVVEAEVELGFVLRFEASEDGRTFHSVRNQWNQELGLVDAEGRAWRYRPHASEPEWLGTGTVGQGAARILGAEGAGLEPMALHELRDR